MNNKKLTIGLLFVCTVTLSGCDNHERSQDVKIAALLNRVHALEDTQASMIDEEASAKVEPALYELRVTWPGQSGGDYSKTFKSSEACETARQQVVAENERLKAESEARVGTSNAYGARIVAVGAPPQATAICMSDQ